MSALIRNAKTLQRKSRGHTVVQTGPRTFQVTSSTSGNVYNVFVDPVSHVGDCTCSWGQYRRTGAGSGCSHVIAVHQHLAELAGRRVSAWQPEDAERQHHSRYSIGDNVILTTRKG
jgi:hypothetical protein